MSRLRMLSIVAMGLAIGCAAASSADEADEKEPVIRVTSMPKEDELSDWIKAIRRKGFVLLFAARQKGHFVACFQAPNDCLALCIKDLKGNRSGSSTFRILNPEGKQIMDLNDANRRLGDLTRTFEVKQPLLSVHTESRITRADGDVIPLMRPVPAQIRVEYKTAKETEDRRKGEWDVILNQVIEWPADGQEGAEAKAM